MTTDGLPPDPARYLEFQLLAVRHQLETLTERLKAVEARLTAIETLQAPEDAVEWLPDSSRGAAGPAGPPAVAQAPKPLMAIPVAPPVPLASAPVTASAPTYNWQVWPQPIGARAYPPPAAPAQPSPGPRSPTARLSGVSLERRIGINWFVKLGALLLLLAAIFFFKYAVDRGWIDRSARCGIIAAGGLLLLGLGEWTFRRGWRVASGGIIAAGLALLYASTFAAGPRYYGLLAKPIALGLMCVTTALAVGLSLRTNLLSTGIMALVGAFLTPILLDTHHNEQTTLILYLVAVDVGFLVLAMRRRWFALVPIVWGGTVVLFIRWMIEFYSRDQASITTFLAWLIYAVLAGHALLAMRRATARWEAENYLGLFMFGNLYMTVILLVIWATQSVTAPIAQVLALTVFALGAARWRGSFLPRIFAAVQVLLALWTPHQLIDPYAGGSTLSATLRDVGWTSSHALVPWIWAFGAIFLIDLWLRSRRQPSAHPSDTALCASTVALVFGATYCLLRGEYGDWMGVYTLALAFGAVLLAGFGRRTARPAGLVQTFFISALALVTLSVPIQFRGYEIMVGWAVEAVAFAVLARIIGGRTAPIMAGGCLLLAIVYFAEVPGVSVDKRLTATWFVWEGVAAPYRLLMALGLAAAAYLCAALAPRMRAFAKNRSEGVVLATLLIWLGSAIAFVSTASYLPDRWVGWVWMCLAMSVSAAFCVRGGRAGVFSAAGHLAPVAVWWFAWGTLGRRIEYGAAVDRPVALNPQFLLGLGLTTAILWLTWWAARRMKAASSEATDAAPAAPSEIQVWWSNIRSVLWIVAAVVPVWAATFEVDRYVVDHSHVFINWALARQMGFSILWAVYAGGLIALGFARRLVLLRYLAILMLAVTVIKVFVADMAGVEAIYRILSFLALGAVLVALSVAYQRYFGRTSAK